MFERFTERARKVVVLAQDEARRFNHNYIGTEHVLLGLILEEEGIAARALKVLGVDLDQVREQVESIVGYGEEGPGAQAPFTPRVSGVLQHALLEAEQLDHDYVGTEHLLLGLTNETEGVAARVLRNLDVDPDAIRREIIERLPDEEVGFDPSGEVEREMEGGWYRTLFRGRVGGIQSATERGTFILDVDYSYRLPTDPALTRANLDPQDVADSTRARLGEVQIETLEGAAEVAGTHLMETFHDLLEITITVVRRPEPSDPLAPTSSVSATFRR